MAAKNNSDNFDIVQVLKDDGVYAYGFGHIAKAAMFDHDLSCIAKGIYAYFCSYTNAKKTAYPKLSTILYDLKIDKKTYYKHFEQLIEYQYISIKKAEGYRNKNVYVINEYVDKVKCDLSSEETSESIFVTDGIKAYGYGTIPKLIMIDKRLTIKAKALVAFLLSLSGAGKNAFPRREALCMYLGISKNTYVSLMNELIACGYIKVTQRRTRKGKFTLNDYHFIVNPTPVEIYAENYEESPKEASVELQISDVEKNVETCGKVENDCEIVGKTATEAVAKNGLNSDFLPCPKISPFLKNGLNSDFSPCPKNSPFLNDHRVPKNPPLPCPKISPHNNINNSNNTISMSASILHPYNKVIKNRLPEGNELIESLHNISQYDYYKQFDDAYACKHCKVVELMIKIFSDSELQYKDNMIRADELWRFFARVLSVSYQSSTSPCVDFIYDVLAYFDQCRSMYQIEHPVRYLKSLIVDRIICEYNENIFA